MIVNDALTPLTGQVVLRRASMHLLRTLSQLILGTRLLPARYLPLSIRSKNLIIDTDLFSDVE